MLRRLVLVLLIALPVAADSFRLYMKDGTWQQVREYKTEEERVRYYSTERSDWEELPLSLVDLAKTESERKRAAEELSLIHI